MVDILVKETSAGPVAFELGPRVFGFKWAYVAVLDERGIATKTVLWRDSENDLLSEAITDAAGLPEQEAVALAATVESEWQTRPLLFNRRDRTIVALTPVFLMVLVPLSILWIVVWLIL